LHPESGESKGLYAYHALVKPVKLRWRFHFETNRPTNRLDKVRPRVCCARREGSQADSPFALLQPEWAFGNVLDVLHGCEAMVDDWFGDLLEENGFPGIDSLVR
jgi:hypothetical protein